ncbi:hypothetical protein [Heyndrickxia oleronia]|uniref:hypothetical protein n=1 Tax=Heyndrickxia oleronia TaxID=38875 RepID=UPI001C0EB5FD|nr:hypothetical protein [Heyndrickxia oleronia]MBU5214550.1 hypothetical protein [Heyndrickxia oleronia]
MGIEFGVVIALLGLILSYLTYLFNKQKENKIDTRQEAKIQAQLDYIGKGVDDIRIDLKSNERQMIALGERITRVEESSKQAHKRLDSIENKGEV